MNRAASKPILTGDLLAEASVLLSYTVTEGHVLASTGQ